MNKKMKFMLVALLCTGMMGRIGMEAAAEAAKAAYGENSGEYKAAAEKAKEAEQAKADAGELV